MTGGEFGKVGSWNLSEWVINGFEINKSMIRGGEVSRFGISVPPSEVRGREMVLCGGGRLERDVRARCLRHSTRRYPLAHWTSCLTLNV